jgi:hypothetical protein
MISSMRSLALAAAGFVAMTFVVPAYAITLNPDPADFSVAESPGQYTVSNNSTAWYIWGFAVSNPGAVGGATATSTFTNWAGIVAQLDFGQSVLLPAFAYATGDADISDINKPKLVTTNLANYIAPGTVADKFHFTPGAVASDFGLLLIDANGDISQVNGVATDGTTPLPAALPLFASGAGVIGFFGWRRKRKALPV